jgi:hypothetical protein
MVVVYGFLIFWSSGYVFAPAGKLKLYTSRTLKIPAVLWYNRHLVYIQRLQTRRITNFFQLLVASIKKKFF